MVHMLIFVGSKVLKINTLEGVTSAAVYPVNT